MNTAQILACLPKEAQQALQIVQLIKNNPGMTLGQASKQLFGVTWNGARLTSAVQMAESSMATMGATDATLTGLIAEGTTIGGTAAGGGGLLATIASYLGILILLGTGTYILSGQLGRLSAGRSVKPGAAMTNRAAYGRAVWGRETRARPVATESAYYVVRVNQAILSVRGKSSLDRGIQYRAFRHGGLSTTIAACDRISGPHKTPQAASEALAAMIQRGTFRPAPLAAGWVAQVGGKRMTIDDRGQIDMQLVRGRVQ